MSTRMAQIEEMLAEDPKDPFLRYGLAMEHASSGDEISAVRLLKELLTETPYVPAYLMAGQMLNRQGELAEAMEVLRKGIEEARQQGNGHAAGEMEGLLMSME